MQHLPTRLALPIKCIVAADGSLLAADSAVRRLKQEKAVHLSITGWHERVATYRPTLPLPQATTHFEYRSALPSMHVNRSGIILQASESLADILGCSAIAEQFDDHFSIVGYSEGLISLLQQEAEIPNRIGIQHLSSSRECFALVDIIRLETEAVAGARLVFLLNDVARAEAGAAEATALPSHSGMGLGRHFASAVRQPLGRILANAETIGSELNGPILEQYSSYAKDIALAARHLSELVGDLEDLDAIDKPDFKVAKEPVELGDIAQRVAGLLALKAADHQIELVVPDRETKGHVIGEFRRVLQIALNLVGNAIRYSPGGSKVRIEVDPAGPSISVIDEGPGIPVEDRERIFTKFERLGRFGDGGSGLGLYISRKLARAMGGELSIGAGEGGGANFTLRLPPAHPQYN
ncbi:MAG: HAMP domain-containing histidine kinase [Sphingomonadales bacterium]|nr:HAMP domain-containing histidine kinase [Sphingomonadales bacterium]